MLKETNGTDFIDEVLEPYADIYERISNAKYESAEGAKEVNFYLEHLVRLDNFDWIPPAMAFFRRHQDDQGAIVEFIKDLERLAYGLLLRRANSTERINRYADVLEALESSNAIGHEGGRSSSVLKKILNPAGFGRVCVFLAARTPTFIGFVWTVCWLMLVRNMIIL